MNSIIPAIRSRDALLMAAQDTVWHGQAGLGLCAAQSYFATSGSVQIGPYSGRGPQFADAAARTFAVA